LVNIKEYPRFNFAVIGAPRTGKSTLVSTYGIDKELWVNSRRVQIGIQEDPMAFKKGVLGQFNGCVIIFDLQYEDTLKECQRNLSQIRQRGSDFPIVVAANKCDFFFGHKWYTHVGPLSPYLVKSPCGWLFFLPSRKSNFPHPFLSSQIQGTFPPEFRIIIGNDKASGRIPNTF